MSGAAGAVRGRSAGALGRSWGVRMDGRRGGRRRAGGVGGEAGFSLVELAISVAILTVAISGIAGSILSAHALNRVNEESALAQEAVQRVIEEMRARPFAEAFAAYNGSVADDGALGAPAAGSGFAVPGLDLRREDADGLVGRVVFPSVLAGGAEELREDVEDEALGMPRDLDADGAVDAADHAGDYAVLPVRVLVEWRGVRGDRTWAVETMLCAP